LVVGEFASETGLSASTESDEETAEPALSPVLGDGTSTIFRTGNNASTASPPISLWAR